MHFAADDEELFWPNFVKQIYSDLLNVVGLDALSRAPACPKKRSHVATVQGSSEASFLRIRNITRIISEAVNCAQQLPVAITLRFYPHPHFDEQREVNWHILPDVQRAREQPPDSLNGFHRR